MNVLQTIRQLAESIVDICSQDRLGKANKDCLLKLQGQIFTQIESLTECQICHCVSDLLIAMTINDSSANLCRECGFEALNRGQIKKGKRRCTSTSGPQNPSVSPSDQSGQRAKSKTNSKVPVVAVAEKSEGLSEVEVVSQVEAETGLKKTTVRRIQRVIREIATLMNLENTVLYVAGKARITELKAEVRQPQTAVQLVYDECGLKGLFFEPGELRVMNFSRYFTFTTPNSHVSWQPAVTWLRRSIPTGGHAVDSAPVVGRFGQRKFLPDRPNRSGVG